MRAARAEAAAFAPILCVFELFIRSYPPEDLVLKPAFVEACAHCLRGSRGRHQRRRTCDSRWPAVGENGHCYNAFALLDKGRIEAIRFKVDLPNYGVFDEKARVTPGPMPGPVVFNRVRIGIPIWRRYLGPGSGRMQFSETGGEILLVPNGSPYWRGKDKRTAFVGRRRVCPKANCACLLSIRFAGGRTVRWRFLWISIPIARLPFSLSGFYGNGGEDGWERGPRALVCVEATRAVRRSKRAMKPITPPVSRSRDYVDKNTGLSAGVLSGMSSGGIEPSRAFLLPRWLSMLSAPAGFIALMLPIRFYSHEIAQRCRAVCPRAWVRYDILRSRPGDRRFSKVFGPIFKGHHCGQLKRKKTSRAVPRHRG